MKYIIKIQSRIDGEYYYVRVRENEWDEVYNPKYATPFESTEAAKDWILQNGGQLEEDMTPIQQKEAIKRYEKWEAEGTVRRTLPILAGTKYNVEYDPQKHDKWFVLEWWLNHSEMSYRIYKTWPSLYTVFSHIFEANTYIDYTNKEMPLKSLTLKTPKDGVFESFESELKEAMERSEFTFRDDEGNLLFGLFTHECLEFGAIYLRQIGDPSKDRWSVCKSRVSNSYYSEFEGSLKEAFEYIRKNHYYE